MVLEDIVLVAVQQNEEPPMSGQMIEEIKDALKLNGRRLIDALYNASVFSTISVGAFLLILVIVGWAISNNVIHVPVFHPDIPVTSGS